METYTDDELKTLLAKPNVKKCSFTEYQCWVMTNFLFCTGVRQRSLMFIKVKDIDFDNHVVYVNVTKNRKPLIVPLNLTMINIFESESKLEFWGFELGGINPSRFKTLCKIRKQYPYAEIYEIQGADKVHTLLKSSHGEEYESSEHTRQNNYYIFRESAFYRKSLRILPVKK